MKKAMLILTLAVLAVSCNSGASTEVKTDSTKVDTTKVVTDSTKVDTTGVK